jgi:hypothetical protein
MRAMFTSMFPSQVLNNIDLYKTSVDTEILTNRPEYFSAPKLLPSWRLRHNVVAVGPSSSASYEKDEHVHRLVWEHRHYMQRAFETGAQLGAALLTPTLLTPDTRHHSCRPARQLLDVHLH